MRRLCAQDSYHSSGVNPSSEGHSDMAHNPDDRKDSCAIISLMFETFSIVHIR